MITTPEVTRLVVGILPDVLQKHSGGLHRALIAFHAGVLLEYVAKCKVLDENAMAVLLPAAMETLQSPSQTDGLVKPALLHEMIVRLTLVCNRGAILTCPQLGSFLVLAAISQKTHLTSKGVKSILVAIAGCAERVSPKQLVRTLVSVCASQDQLEKMPGAVVKTLLTMSYACASHCP